MIASLALVVNLAALSVQDVPVVWTGGDSHVARKQVQLVATEWDWVRLWLRNRGKTQELANLEKWVKDGRAKPGYDYYNDQAVPEVDFARYAIVAVFDVPQQNAGYSVLSCARQGETRVVRYQPRYYSIAIQKPSDARALQRRPYAFILVPRDFAVLRLEEAVVEEKGKAPTHFLLVKELRLPAR